MKLSVIVPVYRKSEIQLREGLEAILSQTLSDFELIVVNDASPDAAGEILAEFAARDPRVKVISLAVNSGVSAARNRGLAAAQGEYIGFVDADDRISVRYYEVLTAIADHYRADMVIASYARFKTDVPPEPEIRMADYLKGKPGKAMLVSTDRVIWNRLYRRETLAGITFPEDLRHCEDLVFVNRALHASQVVVEVDYPGYFYRVAHAPVRSAPVSREESIRRQLDHVQQYLTSLRYLAEFAGSPDVSARERRALNYLVARRLLRITTKIRKLPTAEARQQLWEIFCACHHNHLASIRRSYPFWGFRIDAFYRRAQYRPQRNRQAFVLRALVESSSPRLLWRRFRRHRALVKRHFWAG